MFYRVWVFSTPTDNSNGTHCMDYLPWALQSNKHILLCCRTQVMKELNEFSSVHHKNFLFFLQDEALKHFFKFPSFLQQLPSPGEKGLPLFYYYKHLFMLSLFCIFALFSHFHIGFVHPFIYHIPLGYYVQKPLL